MAIGGWLERTLSSLPRPSLSACLNSVSLRFGTDVSSAVPPARPACPPPLLPPPCRLPAAVLHAAQPALTNPIASLQQEGRNHRLPLQLAGSDGLCRRRRRCRLHGMCTLSRCSLCGRQVTDHTPLRLFSQTESQRRSASTATAPLSSAGSPHVHTHTHTLQLCRCTAVHSAQGTYDDHDVPKPKCGPLLAGRLYLRVDGREKCAQRGEAYSPYFFIGQMMSCRGPCL